MSDERKRIVPSLLRRLRLTNNRSAYCGAACLMFVWKIASQLLPSFFQTLPAL
jgi:hypothetical protein